MTPPYTNEQMHQMPLAQLRTHLAAYLLVHHPGMTNPTDVHAFNRAEADLYLMRGASVLAVRLKETTVHGVIVWTVLADALRLRDQTSDHGWLERVAGRRG